MSGVPNLVDQNFNWGSKGRGIYEHDCGHQVFAHNFVGRSSGAGLHLHGRMTTRRIDGREPEYGSHVVSNNLLFENAQTNVFRGEPSTLSGNVSEGITAAFDAGRLELTWSVTNAALHCEPVPGVTHDFFGKPRNTSRVVAGPFREIPARTATLQLR